MMSRRTSDRRFPSLQMLLATASTALGGCCSCVPCGSGTAATAAPVGAAPIVTSTVLAAPAATGTFPAATAAPASAAVPAPVVLAQPRAAAPAAKPEAFIAPSPVSFKDAVSRAGTELLASARARLGNEPRTLVIDPLIDANTGAQTVSTASMGEQLAALVQAQHAGWTVAPLTRKALADTPLLLIGTLTPVNGTRAVGSGPDAFRVWLTMIDLRTGRVVAKQLDRATVETVNAEPLRFYSESPTWHLDRTVRGYINSCQIDTKTGAPADPDYLARLPAAAVINEAVMAYDAGRMAQAQTLYQEALQASDAVDLRVLNGLYLTHWKLGERAAARQAFDALVVAGLENKRLPLKMLFRPGGTQFEQAGDLAEQYGVWIGSLAQQAGRAEVCMSIVGHTSRTGNAQRNVALSQRRAEAVQELLEHDNRALATRLTASGAGSREALVGLGTDDLRDALDRRVEFRVVDCL